MPKVIKTNLATESIVIIRRIRGGGEKHLTFGQRQQIRDQRKERSVMARGRKLVDQRRPMNQ